mmetsp:Transcript_117760/g.175889  ORF Transcript_117760/g.175889 Transcript_117760/m.175889 type:complete len:223 (-) Transcript_117760:530-1198(-)
MGALESGKFGEFNVVRKTSADLMPISNSTVFDLRSVDPVCVDVSASIVDNNIDPSYTVRQDVSKVVIPWKDGNDKGYNSCIVFKTIKHGLQNVTLRMHLRTSSVDLKRVLGKICKVTDIRKNPLPVLHDIDRGVFKRRSSRQIEVDDAGIHRGLGYLPNRKVVIGKVNLTLLVLVLPFEKVHLLWYAARVYIRFSTRIKSFPDPSLMGRCVSFPSFFFACVY